jgi:hypothetical protein
MLRRFPFADVRNVDREVLPKRAVGYPRNMEVLVILLLVIGVSVVIFNRRARGKRES